MKAVILAGGRGTRLAEETSVRPKPMVEIGGRPILWHIMSTYAAHGITEFVICLGYKGYVVKEYFANYGLHRADVTIDLASHSVDVHRAAAEPWRVTLVDTGDETMTGGRLLRVAEYLGDGDFCMTYGDGVGDIDITSLIAFHEKAGTMATLTAVQPPGRFGALELDGDKVTRFREKTAGDGAWLNGGFFVLRTDVLGLIRAEDMPFEHEPLERLAAMGELSCYRHRGFWQPMDTARDREQLETMWQSGRAPWQA